MDQQEIDYTAQLAALRATVSLLCWLKWISMGFSDG